MALDNTLLYVLVLVSAALNGMVPFIQIPNSYTNTRQNYLLVYMVLCCVLTFFINGGLLTLLSFTKCSRINNWGKLVLGAIISGFLTTLAIAFVHKVEFARNIVIDRIGLLHAPPGDVVSPEIKKEFTVGSIYWVAWAGAFGFAIGGILVANGCSENF